MNKKILSLLLLTMFAITPGVEAKKSKSSFLCLKTVKKGGRVKETCRKLTGKRELASTLATIKLFEDLYTPEEEVVEETPDTFDPPVVEPELEEGAGEAEANDEYCLLNPTAPECSEMEI